jgi:hypothetical protein
VYYKQDSACQDHNVSRQCIRLHQEQYTKHAVQFTCSWLAQEVASNTGRVFMYTLVKDLRRVLQVLHHPTISLKLSVDPLPVR